MFTAINHKFIISVISEEPLGLSFLIVPYRSLSFLIVPYRCPNVYCIFIHIIKYRTAQKIIFQLGKIAIYESKKINLQKIMSEKVRQ